MIGEGSRKAARKKCALCWYACNDTKKLIIIPVQVCICNLVYAFNLRIIFLIRRTIIIYTSVIKYSPRVFEICYDSIYTWGMATLWICNFIKNKKIYSYEVLDSTS